VSVGVICYREHCAAYFCRDIIQYLTSIVCFACGSSREKNKGIGIEVAHFIGDGLFQTDEIH
jgi:hypothetical protein